MADQEFYNVDPFNLDSREPPERLDRGPLGLSMETTGIIVFVCGACALLVLPAVLFYMSITTFRERRRWRQDEKTNAARFDALEYKRQARRIKRPQAVVPRQDQWQEQEQEQEQDQHHASQQMPREDLRLREPFDQTERRREHHKAQDSRVQAQPSSRKERSIRKESPIRKEPSIRKASSIPKPSPSRTQSTSRTNTHISSLSEPRRFQEPRAQDRLEPRTHHHHHRRESPSKKARQESRPQQQHSLQQSRPLDTRSQESRPKKSRSHQSRWQQNYSQSSDYWEPTDGEKSPK